MGSEKEHIPDERKAVQLPEVNMILPRGYFAVYGAMLSHTETKYEAWLETEKEFNRRYSMAGDPEVLRRFSSYDSFCESFRLHRNGVKPGHVEIAIMYVPEI
jgi:hypothetical protein